MKQTMSLAGLSALAWPRVKRFREAAQAGAARHATAMASLCAFALLGAPLFGVMVATCVALRRSRTALKRAVHRRGVLEEEVARLRDEAGEHQALAEAARVDAARQSADLAHGAARERERVAGLVRRAVHEPIRAILDLLDEPSAVSSRRASSLDCAPALTLIRSGLTTLAQTLTDAFDPAPASARAIVLDESAVELRDVIDGVVAMLAPGAIAKGLQLRVSIDRSVAACVLADRARVGQVVFSLLSHAVESAEAGRITITARAESLNAGSQRIFIGASGTRAAGPLDSRSADAGTPRTAAGETRDPELALCRILAHRMGGDITVASGAAFGICAAFHAPFTVERHGRAPAGSERRKAVVELAAQDERRALCDLLDKLGVSIVAPGMSAPAHVDLWFADRCARFPHQVARRASYRSPMPSSQAAYAKRAAASNCPSIRCPWCAVQRACDVRGIDRAAWPPSVRVRPAPVQRQRCVLVVDDNEINRRVVARQLDVLGHRSAMAGDGRRSAGSVEPAVLRSVDHGSAYARYERHRTRATCARNEGDERHARWC